MSKILKFSAVAALAAISVACSDADFDKMTRFNNEADIMCYSGSPTPIFTDRSTGMVRASETGNGLYYRSKTTGKLIQLYMDCVVIEDK